MKLLNLNFFHKKKEDEIQKCINLRKQRGEEDMMILNVIKKRTLTFMFVIIFVGLLVPFVAQWVPEEYLPWDIQADIWNSYVSIILGIVATFCSLLSIYLAFYAQNQTIKSNKDTIDDFNEIRREINNSVLRLGYIEKMMDIIHDDIRRMDKQPTSTLASVNGRAATVEKESELFTNGKKEDLSANVESINDN